MRHLLTTTLSVTVLFAGIAVPQSSQASTTAEEPDADALYEEGKAAFEAKDYETATDRWERSYRASGDPLVLYNIGQAYQTWYEESQNLDHLEKAQVALQELSVVLEEDPTLGDPEEVAVMLKEIDGKIEAAKGPAEPDEPDEPDEPEGPIDEEPKPEKEPPSKAKKLQWAGIGTMTAGSVFVVAGIAVGAAFLSKGGKLTEDLNELYAMPEPPEDEIEALRAQGKQSNTIAGVGMGLGIALGAAGIAAGAVLFTKGKKLEAEESGDDTARTRIRVMPTLGGLVLSGRF